MEKHLKDIKGLLWAIYVVLLISICLQGLNAQERVKLSIFQDLKFATIGDKDRGYDAFTLDVVARVEMTGNQQKYGYMVVYPEFEYAEIDGIYKRWSVNVGYAFNKLIVDSTTATIAIGYGWIDRYSSSSFSWSGMGELMYRFSDAIEAGFMIQFTDRSDLGWLYNDRKIKPSGFFGLKYNL